MFSFKKIKKYAVKNPVIFILFLAVLATGLYLLIDNHNKNVKAREEFITLLGKIKLDPTNKTLHKLLDKIGSDAKDFKAIIGDFEPIFNFETSFGINDTISSGSPSQNGATPSPSQNGATPSPK